NMECVSDENGIKKWKITDISDEHKDRSIFELDKVECEKSCELSHPLHFACDAREESCAEWKPNDNEPM
ncbi:hypothetical protein PMAYCL1PPCAC_26759, partial [Pristionchus mayeri]